MITLVEFGNATNVPVHEYRGLSTDTKPVKNIPNGSVFFEMDTNKKYFFDKENSLWLTK